MGSRPPSLVQHRFMYDTAKQRIVKQNQLQLSGPDPPPPQSYCFSPHMYSVIQDTPDILEKPVYCNIKSLIYVYTSPMKTEFEEHIVMKAFLLQAFHNLKSEQCQTINFALITFPKIKALLSAYVQKYKSFFNAIYIHITNNLRFLNEM